MSALVVGTNIEAINAQNELAMTDTQLSHTEAILSSGLAINSSQDGPAAYAIGQSLTQQNDGDTTALQNIAEGVSVLQIANGGMQQINGILDQMYQLAASSANSATATSTVLSANAAQYSALAQEITDIVTATQYGGQQLLNGSFSTAASAATFQIGPYNGNTLTVLIATITALSLGVGGVLNQYTTAINTSASAANVLTSLAAGIASLTNYESIIGSAQDEMTALGQNLTVEQQNVTSAYSDIIDANMAQETTTFTSEQILMQSGTAMLSQAQQNPSIILKLLS
jgi:flagellin